MEKHRNQAETPSKHPEKQRKAEEEPRQGAGRVEEESRKSRGRVEEQSRNSRGRVEEQSRKSRGRVAEEFGKKRGRERKTKLFLDNVSCFQPVWIAFSRK